MSLAEQLVGEARARRPRRMTPRERAALGASGLCYMAAATAVAALLPSERPTDVALIAALVVAYAPVSRIRFEFGNTYVTAEQLILVPMLMLVPLPLVPLLVAAASVVAMLPDFMDRSWHRERALSCVSDSWALLGPVLVLSALSPGEPALVDAGVYALAFAAQLAADLAWSTLRERLVDGIPARTTWGAWVGCARFDAVLTPIAFLAGLTAVDEPLALAAIAPLVWVLQVFSRERRERYAATLELHRAYRGTVMLLSDVIEFDDPHTAQHSRSIVDLVDAVADELAMDPDRRQELEFAALLHDVGKISVPKEILNKPAALTPQEFGLMKSHTIEGQFMLDRVGGLLARVGELVRSCHERWDGRGYPDGLAGEAIPLAARIVFACDAYDAMTTDRPYRPAMSREHVLRELAANAGTQFDPRVVAALLEVVQNGEPALLPVDEVRAILAHKPVPHRLGAAS
jgi:HD-GYP domain-containing protein (c-di-GMP phosphodiesterase class II)